MALATPKVIQTEAAPTAPHVTSVVPEFVTKSIPTKVIPSVVATLEAVVTTADPEPFVAMMNDQGFIKLEGIGELAAPMEPTTASSNRVPTYIRSPSPYRESHTIRIPTPPWEPTPFRSHSYKDVPTFIRSPCPSQLINETLLAMESEAAIERFNVPKGYRYLV